MDSSKEMLKKALENLTKITEQKNQEGEEIELIGAIADEEDLPFEDGEFDLVISNLNLHWVNDLQGCFQRINQILKPDGVFLASLFGDQSLLELQ